MEAYFQSSFTVGWILFIVTTGSWLDFVSGAIPAEDDDDGTQNWSVKME
jgi:hypothetical protein